MSSTKSPHAVPVAAPLLTGSQRPRIHVAPAYISSAADEAIDLAARTGLILDDWQAWTLTEALGERADGKWAAFEVGVVVSRQNGKGSLLEARELAGLYLFGEELIMHTAHEFKTAQEAFRRVLMLVESTPDLDAKVQNVRTSHGEEGIELRGKPTIITGPGKREIVRSVNARLRFIARSTTSGRGFTGDLLIYDESMILDHEDVSATIPVLSARHNATDGGPQIWYTGSAGIGPKSTQLAMIRHRALEGAPRRLCYVEWSIDPHVKECPPGCRDHDEPDDRRSWAKANPGYPHRITDDAIESERDAMDEDGFGIERLGVGVYPMPRNGWAVISRELWEDQRVPEDEPPHPGKPAFGIDTTPDRSATAIGVAGIRDDGRYQVELADHRAGTSWVVERAVELDKGWHPVTWVIDPAGTARTFIEPLTKAGLRLWEPTTRDAAAAYGDFVDDARDGRMFNSGDRAFRVALAGAATRKIGEQKGWDRTSSAVDISPVVAVTLALAGHKKYARRAYDLLKSLVGPTGDSDDGFGGWSDVNAPGWRDPGGWH